MEQGGEKESEVNDPLFGEEAKIDGQKRKKGEPVFKLSRARNIPHVRLI